MRPLTLRTRVTLWFIGLTMVLLAGFSATLYVGLGRALKSGVDAELAARAESMVGVSEWDEEIGDVEFKLAPKLEAELLEGHPGRALEVWTWPARRNLRRSGEPIADPLPDWSLDPGATSRVAFADVGGSPPRRLCTLLAQAPEVAAIGDDPDRPAFEVLVRVTDSVSAVGSQLAHVQGLILLLIGFSSLIVPAFAAFLSRRFVRPLQELGAAAATVRAGDRAQMPRRGNDDEVDRLADVLDTTFASLEGALDRQTRFTANAAHELRNPIAVIRNAADVALRHERSGAEYRRFLDDVLATSQRMGRIVEALLQLARLDAGTAHLRFKEVDLVVVARQSAAALVAGDGHGDGRVRIQDGAPVVVRGEQELLRVLIDNLLANALQHGDGGRIDLSIGRDGRGCASLRVRDFGPGVPAEERTRVFERFFRGDASPSHANGAGLGLSIVADIARLHDASCKLEDAAPGTRVRVDFPPTGER